MIPESYSEKALGAHWVERKPIPTNRAFFEFEMKLAQEIQRRTGMSLEDIILSYTWNLKNKLFLWNSETKERTVKPGIDFTNGDAAVEAAYQSEVEEMQDHKAIPYHTAEAGYDTGTRFGCI